MSTVVYCRTLEQGVHSFYMKVDGKRYYLFSQDYRKGVQDYFGHAGVSIDDAINHSKGHNDKALMRTMDKVLTQVKYIESEFNVIALRRTAIKKSKNYKYKEYKYA